MSLSVVLSFLNISSTFFILIMTARIPHTSQPSCHLSNSSPSISRWTWVASNWETFTEWRPSFTFTKARLMSSTFSKAFAAVATPSITVSIYDRKQDGLAIFFAAELKISRSFILLTLREGKNQISAAVLYNGAMRTHTLGAGQFVQFILPVKRIKHRVEKLTLRQSNLHSNTYFRSSHHLSVNSTRSKGSKFVARAYPIQLASRLIMCPSEQRYNDARKS